MNFRKTSLLVLTSAVMAVGLAACNDSSTEKMTVGVILYNYTDIQGKTIKSYCSYLEKNFPVKFVYESVGSDDAQHITGVEDLITQGVNAIISGYDTALSKSIKAAEAAKVYYMVALGDVSATTWNTATNAMEAVDGVDSKYFLGGTKQMNGNPAAIGDAYATAAHAAGLKKIGAISFPTFVFADGQTIYNEFKTKMASLDASAEVYDLQTFMFTQELCNAEVTTLLTNHPDCDGVLGLGSGLDYIYPALRDHNSSAKVMALGYNDSVESLMSSGAILTAGTNNYTQIMASCFARVYDAFVGKSYADRKSTDLNAVVDYPTIASRADVADFKKYIVPEDYSTGSVTAKELQNAMVAYNANATWSGLNTLTSRTMAQIKAARA